MGNSKSSLAAHPGEQVPPFQPQSTAAQQSTTLFQAQEYETEFPSCQDHIPRLSNPAPHSTCVTPYLGRYPDSKEDIRFNILRNRHYTTDRFYEEIYVLYCVTVGDRSLGLIRYLQDWLILGFLAEVARQGRTTCDLGDFIQEANGIKCLTTVKLRSFTDVWVNSVVRTITEHEDPKLVVEEVDQVFLDAEPHVRNLMTPNFDCIPESHQDLFKRTVIAIISMYGALNHARNAWAKQVHQYAAQVQPHYRGAFIPTSFGSGLYSNILINALYNRGWCLSEIHRMRKTVTYNDGLIVCAQLQRRRVHSDHSKCSYYKCDASLTEKEGYRPRHFCSTCNCDYIKAPTYDIAAGLDNGSLPVLEIVPSRPCTFRLWDGQAIPFVAISHVWSHKMGNPVENALPTCVLHQIAKWIRPYFGHDQRVCVWMDTLCVPVGSQYKQARETAIRRMADIYSKAHRVLVLDAELFQSSFRDPLEVALRIVLSDWSKRLWTCQESELADRIVFQFCDGVVGPGIQHPKLNEIVAGAVDDNWQYTRPHSWRTLMARLFNHIGLDIKGGSLQKVYRDHRRAALPWLLEFRTTSRLEDEPVCLASMLRMPQNRIAAIQSVPASQRMAYFYIHCQQPSLKWVFIASQSSQRLQIPGFRWAPSSFLGGDNQGTWPTLNDHGDRPDLGSPPKRAFATFKRYDWSSMSLMPHPNAGAPSYVLEIQCPGFRLCNPTGTCFFSPPHEFSFLYRDCMFHVRLDEMRRKISVGHIALVLHNDPQAVERCFADQETFQTRAFVINDYDLYAEVETSRKYVKPYSCVANVWWHRSGQRDRALVGASELPYQFKVHGEMLPYGTTWLIS